MEIDLAADARLFPPELGPLVPTHSGAELAVDKVLAVFGQAEARDFIDLWMVEPRYGIDRLCKLAAEKDRGFPTARRRVSNRLCTRPSVNVSYGLDYPNRCDTPVS